MQKHLSLLTVLMVLLLVPACKCCKKNAVKPVDTTKATKQMPAQEVSLEDLYSSQEFLAENDADEFDIEIEEEEIAPRKF